MAKGLNKHDAEWEAIRDIAQSVLKSGVSSAVSTGVKYSLDSIGHATESNTKTRGKTDNQNYPARQLLEDALALPPDSEAHQLARQISDELETTLINLGLDLDAQYQLSHTTQAEMIKKVIASVVTNKKIEKLAALVGKAMDGK